MAGSRMPVLAALAAIGFLVGGWLAPQPLQAQESGAWRVKDLIQATEPKIQLRDRRNRILHEVEVAQLVYLYAVMSAIEEAAEIGADLYIVPGNSPNAFAGNGNAGENIVGINFAMLDLIGKDVHAAAAILGHELAHLKLNHREDLEKAQNRAPSSVFSASGTRYSRDNEREADYLGMIWSVEAGYDPQGAVRVHETLYKLSKTSPSGFSGSHPSSIERITVLKSMARRLGR
ncbi:M48 family metallopeptidase [Elongatibacter sediminis]|uniref:M48 family metallopeptidase n=1 Tax=Elongatibacter sediminis TaxID=3119006 RepID=A0AAW9REZ0_9GAMM